MVDSELLLSSWLRDTLYETPVYVDVIPDEPAWPLVRITRVGGGPSRSMHALWLDKPWFQIDVYGGTKTQAQALCDEVVEALPSLPGAHSEGVVAGVEIASVRSLPDIGYRPPRPRYVLSVYLSVHP